MKTRTTRATAVIVGAAFGLGAATVGMAPAVAAPGDCPVEATLISGDICQIIVTAADMSGSSRDYTLPAGISKLSAVLVGGGGMGGFEDRFGYSAGGAGEVTVADVVESPPTTAPITMTVSIGLGDTAFVGGGATTIDLGSYSWEAAGGFPSVSDGEAGASGNGNAGGAFTDGYGPGGGGAFQGSTSQVGGLGYIDFSDLVSETGIDPELWSDLSSLSAYTGIAYGGDGADLGGPFSPASPHGLGSGGHSSLWDDWGLPGQNGMDGFAVIRFTVEASDPEMELSVTSVDQGGTVIVTVSGLYPNEANLTAEVHSTPFPLGPATASASGMAQWTFNVPSDFPTGPHTVTATRGDHGNQQLSLPLTVNALPGPGGDGPPDPGGDGLSDTGGNVDASIGLLAAAIILGGVVVFLAPRRRHIS